MFDGLKQNINHEVVGLFLYKFIKVVKEVAEMKQIENTNIRVLKGVDGDFFVVFQ